MRPPIPSTGYIVSIFKVFEGDDGLKFEQNWLYWTGTLFDFYTLDIYIKSCTITLRLPKSDFVYFAFFPNETSTTVFARLPV